MAFVMVVPGDDKQHLWQRAARYLCRRRGKGYSNAKASPNTGTAPVACCASSIERAEKRCCICRHPLETGFTVGRANFSLFFEFQHSVKDFAPENFAISCLIRV